MRTKELRKAVRSSVTAALGFLTGILVLLAMPGIAPAGTTERVSVDGAGNQGDSLSLEAAISADGRFVVFVSSAITLVPGDTNGVFDVFVHDRQTRTTERVSVDSAGNQANGPSSGGANRPSISADGRFVAFRSFASNLVPGDTNGSGDPRRGPGFDVFVHDRQTRTTERVSVDSGGIEGNHNSGQPSISADGHFVAFASDATNLVRRDTNGVRDVFVHDRLARITKGGTVGPAGMTQGNGASSAPSISADGRVVAFQSGASNLVPEDTNGTPDVFAHGREALP